MCLYDLVYLSCFCHVENVSVDLCFFYSFDLKLFLYRIQSSLNLARLRFWVSRASPGSTSQHDLHLRNPLPMADSQKICY